MLIQTGMANGMDAMLIQTCMNNRPASPATQKKSTPGLILRRFYRAFWRSKALQRLHEEEMLTERPAHLFTTQFLISHLLSFPKRVGLQKGNTL